MKKNICLVFILIFILITCNISYAEDLENYDINMQSDNVDEKLLETEQEIKPQSDNADEEPLEIEQEGNSQSDSVNENVLETETTQEVKSQSDSTNENTLETETTKKAKAKSKTAVSKEINVEYEYNADTNTVTAKIVSNVKLKDTKPTWELSSDKLTYAKTFSTNQTYTTPVQDIDGNVTDVTIKITLVKKLSADVQYIYNEDTNTVTAKIVSNVKLADTKPTWKLSSDKFTYTKIFSANQTYTTPVQDINGNKINVTINITTIEKLAVKVQYEYNADTNTVTAKIVSNVKLADTKPTWKLSSDKYTYTKTFSANQTYTTAVQDINGNKVNATVKITLVKKLSVKVEYIYNSDTQSITAKITSNVKLKDTKPTWKLSDDGFVYTKTFKISQNYTTPVQDVSGNVSNVRIVINISDYFLVGVDVSHHNGKIDWEKVKNAGIDFAIIRCGYGQNFESQDDTTFEYNVSECERLGIPYGIYLYSYAVDTICAESEAEHVLRLIKGHNPEYGIWLDLEDESVKVTNTELANIAEKFLEKLKTNGYKNVGVYANLTWWQLKLTDARFDKYNKWVAQWGSGCTYDKKYIMWQYTNSGSVDGISGNVDMDIFYK